MLVDCTKVIGRGIILICDYEDIHVGDTITLKVTGVERLSPLPSTKIGLIVNPNITITKNNVAQN